MKGACDFFNFITWYYIHYSDSKKHKKIYSGKKNLFFISLVFHLVLFPMGNQVSVSYVSLLDILHKQTQTLWVCVFFPSLFYTNVGHLIHTVLHLVFSYGNMSWRYLHFSKELPYSFYSYMVLYSIVRGCQ